MTRGRKQREVKVGLESNPGAVRRKSEARTTTQTRVPSLPAGGASGVTDDAVTRLQSGEVW